MAFPQRAPDLNPFLCPEADFCGPKGGKRTTGSGLWGRDWDYGVGIGIMGLQNGIVVLWDGILSINSAFESIFVP